MAQFAWMADPSGNIFWYNKRWFDYTGTTSEDMVGWGWQQVHHPDHAERVMKKIAEHFSSGEPWEDTFPLRARDGTYRWFLSRAMPSRDDAGNIVLWCGTNTDVTEQRDAADRLRQKAQLIAQSHEAIFVWDLERGIVSWNRGCEELYGYSASEVLGKRSHDLLRTRFSMSVEEFEERLRQDRSWAGEIEHCAKSGWPVWVDSRQELIDVGGRQLVLETNRDITEKRAAEDNRRLLLGELDHRVKNTLAIVQAIASQTARRTQSIESFTSSFGARLQALASAHNLLATTSWSGAWLHDIIASQLGETSAVAGQIRTAGPEAFLPQQVALQLSLIFHELGTNAVRFGALSRPTGRIDVQWTVDQQQPHRLNLSWRESGGPPVERPRSRGFGTTLIERAGAQAQLTAELQFLREGILCQVSADIGQQGGIPSPIFDPRARAWNSGGRRSAGTSRTPVRRVLVIEDEPLIALELEEILSSSGYESAGIAGSVSEALARIASSTPDLAILDGNLVGEKVDRVVADLELRAIPYVVVTGFTRESLPAAINPTLVPVLRKPVRAQELLSALQTLAGGGRRDV